MAFAHRTGVPSGGWGMVMAGAFGAAGATGATAQPLIASIQASSALAVASGASRCTVWPAP